ncbi:SAM-dependent methyltransferase [Paroceanicella profunda]|uniref:SAM-dependent methyltransferase n=1 Tax=Paroceanicella profunda TaxID=2579971 RepID=A0A5B8FGY3_9RHOB|nr:SAM-dependent methyltransferase [Paroceanicella profunda]QDL91378.1 SAM-dependent methyltransferase [Paroceanicella profunda]
MTIQIDPAAPGKPSHLGIFLSQFLRRPGRIVALSPSSRDLARMMTAGLGPRTGPVIELGSGTGKITEAILARGVAEADLTLFEIDPVFADLLAAHYPRAWLLRISASHVGEAGRPDRPAGAVISGLPLLSMPRGVQRDILSGAFDIMGPGGVFVQFTYGFRPPVDRALRAELGLSWTRSRRVWNNLPPARVYTFRKAG